MLRFLCLFFALASCGPNGKKVRQASGHQPPATYSVASCPEGKDKAPAASLTQSAFDLDHPYIRPTLASDHATVRYFRGQIPICGVFGRVDHIAGQTFTHAPPALAGLKKYAQVGTWQSVGASAQALAKAMGHATEPAVVSAEKCWWPEGGKLLPAWEIELTAEEAPIRGFSNGQAVFAAAINAFEVTGSARIFSGNLNGDLVGVSLPNLDDSGRLSSAHFRTVLPRGWSLANAADGNFDFSPDDPRFAETSLFANAELMVAWLERPEHHYDFGCLPIEIRPHDNAVNNGGYKPAKMNPNGLPTIFMGDGDGSVLQNLATDSDAISHEVGHHVVYRTMTDLTDLDTVVLHEALADFFVYTRTGNACLGETICPAASPLCAVPGACLRTADNTMKLTDANLPTEAHRRSQLVSGMLWDLTQELGRETVEPLVFKAVDFLLPKSSYRDLMIALALADAELAKGVDACHIFDAGMRRGLSLAGLKCEDYLRP